MYTWRITKYNPLFRDENGHFLRDDWTSIADIGKILQSNHGQPVTVEDYQSSEDAYIETITTFMKELHVQSLQISYLEKNQKITRVKDRIKQEREKYPLLYREDLLPLWRTLKAGQQLDGQELMLVCRLTLRGYLWCKLEAPTHMFVHFGWDYYMYIGATETCERATQRARQSGLFVEPMASPYSEE
jgi:hypothetical protein